MKEKNPLLVLGIGNYLMGDEGVGVHAVKRMEKESFPSHVRFLDGGTGGFHLLSLFQEYDSMILIDATLDAGPPGTVRVIRPRFASDFPRALSAHDIGLRDLIESAALLGGLPETHLVTISIDPLQSLSTELTSPVYHSLDKVTATVKQILWSAGTCRRS